MLYYPYAKPVGDQWCANLQPPRVAWYFQIQILFVNFNSTQLSRPDTSYQYRYTGTKLESVNNVPISGIAKCEFVLLQTTPRRHFETPLHTATNG